LPALLVGADPLTNLRLLGTLEPGVNLRLEQERISFTALRER